MTENDGSDIRRLLFDYIKKNPGASFRVLQTAFRMTEGNLRYHLHYLESKKRIIFEKEGRDRCYFTYAKKRSPYAKDMELSSDQERLLELIQRNPGLSPEELRVRCGKNDSSFTYDLRKLREGKLIWHVKRGDRYGYEAVTQERLEDEMFLDLVKRFTEGEATKDEVMTLVSRLERRRKDSRG
jgi:predicted transcriptional regulator